MLYKPATESMFTQKQSRNAALVVSIDLDIVDRFYMLLLLASFKSRATLRSRICSRFVMIMLQSIFFTSFCNVQEVMGHCIFVIWEQLINCT